jgi:hypothetical protein
VSSAQGMQDVVEVERLQAGSVHDGNDARRWTVTPRRSTRERRRCSPQRRDDDGAALGEGMATARLWARGMATAQLWARRGDGDGVALEQMTAAAISPIHAELSAGAAGCFLCLTGRVVGPHNMRTRKLSCSVGCQ